MDRRVLVTGASGGIGEATVELLIENDIDVIATARRDEDLERLESKGARAFKLDLRNRGEIEGLVQRVRDEGPLDAVVHNAGLGMPGAVEDLGPEAWQKQFQVNVFGAVELTRQLIPLLKETEGRFIFISSQAALVSLPLYAAYCASKKAIEAVADGLRMELRDEGIKVVIIEPGPVATPFHDRAETHRAEHVDEEQSPYQESYQKMDRTITERVVGKVPPEAVAEAVLKAVRRRWVPARFHVGKLPWLGTMLVRLLPSTLRDRVVRWSIGV